MTAPAPAPVVYLLHFDRPYGPGGGANGRGTARHYTGVTDDLAARLAEHAAGRGARLTAVVRAAGIGWQLARTWPGGRARERQLKRQGGASRHCPLCGVRPRTAPAVTVPVRRPAPAAPSPVAALTARMLRDHAAAVASIAQHATALPPPPGGWPSWHPGGGPSPVTAGAAR